MKKCLVPMFVVVEASSDANALLQAKDVMLAAQKKGLPALYLDEKLPIVDVPEVEPHSILDFVDPASLFQGETFEVEKNKTPGPAKY